MLLREPWRTRLLFVSFAANLLLIPLAGARLWTPNPPPTAGLPRTEVLIDRMVRTLPPEDAPRFRDTMEAHLGDIEAARILMLTARGAMARAIGRTPYDPVAVQASMQAWRSSWHHWSETLSDGMLAALPSLSDQGRERLAQAGRRGSPGVTR